MRGCNAGDVPGWAAFGKNLDIPRENPEIREGKRRLLGRCIGVGPALAEAIQHRLIEHLTN
jgi:hypothetical protein